MILLYYVPHYFLSDKNIKFQLCCDLRIVTTIINSVFTIKTFLFYQDDTTLCKLETSKDSLNTVFIVLF